MTQDLQAAWNFICKALGLTTGAPQQVETKKGSISHAGFIGDRTTATRIPMMDATVFKRGDLVRPDGSGEVILVQSIDDNAIIVARGYGNTTPASIKHGMDLYIIGNAAITTGTPQRAKVGDRVRSNASGFEYKVERVSDVGAHFDNNGYIHHGDYTIVPEPERETFTGDLEDFPSGVFQCVENPTLFVVSDASSSGYMNFSYKPSDKDDPLIIYQSLRTIRTYHRISDDPSSFINPALLEGGV